jgi:hypothetical protein
MSVALAVDSLQGVPDVTEREEFVQGVLTFSGNYPANGDTLSFAGSNKIQSRSAPNRVEIYEEPLAATQTATGATFVFAKGTTQANGKVQIFTPGAGTGTIVSTSTAPTITTGTNASVTAVIATNGGALTQATGAAGITGVQAPTITSTFTGTGGTAAQFPAGAYGSTFATTTVKFRAWFPLGQ